MTGWQSLRVDLRRLLEESPGALVVGPNPDSERREPPIHIQLAAWATDIGATLNTKYGSLLDLRVGAPPAVRELDVVALAGGRVAAAELGVGRCRDEAAGQGEEGESSGHGRYTRGWLASTYRTIGSGPIGVRRRPGDEPARGAHILAG